MSVDEEEEQVMETEPAIDDVASSLRTVLATDPAILLDALVAAFRIAKDALQVPKDRYHVIIVPDAGEASVTTVSSIEELVAILREVRHAGGQAFGCRGDILLPSKGGHYLVTPWGRFPLFAEDHDTEVDPRGYLGPLPAITKVVPVPAAESPVNGVADEDDDSAAEDHEEGDPDDEEDVDEDEDN